MVPAERYNSFYLSPLFPMAKEYRSFDDVFPSVQDAMTEALGIDRDEAAPSATYIGDLGAESIDDLDVAFRLEKTHQIDIPRSEFLDAVGYPDGSVSALASLIRRFGGDSTIMNQESVAGDIQIRCRQYLDPYGKVLLERTSEFLAEVQKMFNVPSREFEQIRTHWLRGSLKTEAELPNPEEYWQLPQGELRRITEYLRMKTGRTIGEQQ